MTVKESPQEASPARPAEAASPLRAEVSSRITAARARWQAARDRESAGRESWKKDFTTVSGATRARTALSMASTSSWPPA